MSTKVKVLTKENGEKFNQGLWGAAQAVSPEFIFTILHKITDRLELQEDGSVAVVFTQEFQDIQETNNESK